MYLSSVFICYDNISSVGRTELKKGIISCMLPKYVDVIEISLRVFITLLTDWVCGLFVLLEVLY